MIPQAIELAAYLVIVTAQPLMEFTASTTDSTGPTSIQIAEHIDFFDTTEPIATRDELLKETLFFVATNPGADAEDLARHLNISLTEAVDLSEDLLRRGLLGFA